MGYFDDFEPPGEGLPGKCQEILTKKEKRPPAPKEPPTLLDQVFHTRAHVAVLRVLSYHARGATARALSRATGVNRQTCSEALARLRALELVQPRQGRRFALDMEHPLVRDGLVPIFELEEKLSAAARK